MARIYHTAHKRAKINNIVRNLVTELLLHEQVVVTREYKQRVKQKFDYLITFAKLDTLAGYRAAFKLIRKSQRLKDHQFLIVKLKQLARQYENRHGGYLTSALLANRRGDDAPRYCLKLVP